MPHPDLGEVNPSDSLASGLLEQEPEVALLGGVRIADDGSVPREPLADHPLAERRAVDIGGTLVSVPPITRA